MYTCGANQFGQLGYQTDLNIKQAGQVLTLKDQTVCMVACGDTFTVATTQGNPNIVFFIVLILTIFNKGAYFTLKSIFH